VRPLLISLLLAGCAARHAPISTGPPPPPSRHLLVAQIDDELSTKNCDHTHFTARVVAPPEHRGERVRGHVIRCDNGYGPTPARLDLAIDWPPSHVTAAPLEPLVKSPDGKPERSGAIGGVVIGAALMGLPGAVIGYSIGKVGGSAKEVLGDRQQVRIPKGALLTLEKR
jgi:hypothetical protein